MGIPLKGICCLVFALILFGQASAQQRYSLQSLIDSSKRYLPLLKQKQALVQASTAVITETRHSFLPSLKASEQLNIASNNSLAGSLFTFGITPSSSGGIRAENTMQPATANVAVVYSEYELVNFGLNSAKLQAAKSFQELYKSDLQKDEYTVQSNIVKLYLNILKQQYRLSADLQNIQRYQSIYMVIQSLTASGLKPGADSSLALAELSKTKINYNQTLGKLNELKVQLSFFTGIESKQLSVDTTNGLFRKKASATSFAIDTSSNPLLTFFEQKRNVFSVNENLIKKSYLPKITLAGSVWARGSSIQFNDQFKSLGTGLGYQRFNYALGVAFTYNLFNGIYKKDKLAINKFQLQASEHELMQQQLVLKNASAIADNMLDVTQRNLLELPVQLQSAEAVYNQKMAQYKAGLISLIDLTNATFVLYRSQTDYIETMGDWYLAQLDKATATGNLNQFIQTIN